jgi:hypothetical protein
MFKMHTMQVAAALRRHLGPWFILEKIGGRHHCAHGPPLMEHATDTPTPESKLHDDVRGFPHLTMAAVAWPMSTWSVCEKMNNFGPFSVK